MTNTIKVLNNETIAMNVDGKTILVTKRMSTLGLKSWFNIKGNIYA